MDAKACFSTPTLVMLTAWLVMFAPALGLACGETPDDKDDVIAKQKQSIETLKKQLEIREKRERMLIDQLVQAEAMKKELDILADRLGRAAKDAEVQIQQSKKNSDRLAVEIELLRKAIDNREVSIVKHAAELQILRGKLAISEAMAKAKQEHNEILLEQVRHLTRKLAVLEAGTKPEPPVRNPIDANPPKVLVNGKIEKVDGGILQVSLGTDHGVEKNHTLEVYRLAPEPKYLGMIRILEATPHNSIARFVGVGAAAPPMLRVGDLVTSKLMNAKPK